MEPHWSWGNAYQKLRTEVNTLAWLHAEQRVLMDTVWILKTGMTIDDALALLHSDPAPCPSADEQQRSEEIPLEGGP